MQTKPQREENNLVLKKREVASTEEEKMAQASSSKSQNLKAQGKAGTERAARVGILLPLGDCNSSSIPFGSLPK